MPVATALSRALARDRQAAQPASREAEEDRETGDRAEYENLRLGQREPLPVDVVRDALQDRAAL